MNIIIKNEYIQPYDKQTLFGDEDVIYLSPNIDISNFCVSMGLYRSTSQARQAGRVGKFPEGWTEMKLNRKTPAWIWNPTE